MLERSFVHVPGIGYPTERRLWRQGARSWAEFLEAPARFRLTRLPLVIDTIGRSAAALRRGDHRFFRERLPSRDHWRALPDFPGRVAYLDIETDSTAEFDSITVIGLFDRSGFRQFVRGENLLEFRDALDEAALLVTFFGSGFDLPVLGRAFLGMRFHQLHVDLCPAVRRLGLTGGLKRVERVLGIPRNPATEGLGGRDAVRLWGEWLRGSGEALQLLLDYNREDVMNLVPLAEFAYKRLREALEAAP